EKILTVPWASVVGWIVSYALCTAFYNCAANTAYEEFSELKLQAVGSSQYLFHACTTQHVYDYLVEFSQAAVVF
ncbi:MAG: hypothetical protein ACRD39_03190, partial [Nitrososphaeraceae archaeon]